MSFVADRVDAALEWSVVGSFTSLGSALRRRLDHWAPLDGGRVAGRVMVMTGATSGLGLEAARTLAGLGASIEVIARDARKAEATCAGLREATGNPKVAFVVADTGDLAAVRRAAAELLHRHPAIHVLVHNAGALDDVRQESPQGIELTVASQVVGPFLLTGLLLPALRSGAPARVLWVSSGGMYSEPLSVARLEMPADGYDGTTAYARAKRAQVTLAELWAKRLAGDRIVVHSMHPGWADTPAVRSSLPNFYRVMRRLLRTPAEGADTIVWLAVCPRLVGETGQFWFDRKARRTHFFRGTREDPDDRQRLWTLCCELAGIERHGTRRGGSAR